MVDERLPSGTRRGDNSSGARDVTPGQRAWAVARQVLPLAAILLLAVELRLIFTAGMVQLDSLTYAHLARNLVDGIPVSTTVTPWATARIGLYGPVAVLYAWFGVSDVTTLAWPFLCSLFGIVCAYGVGRVLDGEAAGLLAAFLWAVLPTNVAAGTALLGDGPIAALSIAVVLLVLVAESARGFMLAAAITANLTCLLLGMLNKPLMVLVVLFLAVYLLWTRPKNRLAWLWVTAMGGIAVAAYAHYFRDPGTIPQWSGAPPLVWNLARTATDWWSQVVTGHPEFSWISPLWMVAASALLTLRRRPAYVPLLWFGSMFLYLELGSNSPFHYAPIIAPPNWAARHFLLVAAPAVIATGLYLALDMKPATARWLSLLVSAVTGVIAFVGSRHATHLAWGITGEAPLDLPFAVISALATACVIFGGIASPALLTGAATKWKSAAVALLLVAIGLAALNPSYRAATEHRGPWATTITEAVSFLDRSPPLPILVQNELFGLRLDYASRFRLGFNSSLRQAGPQARIGLAPKDPNSVREAYVLIDEFYVNPDTVAKGGDGPAYLRSPPARWAEVAHFGDRDGYRLRVYRVSYAQAGRELDAARAAVRATRSPQALRQLMVAATGAGDYCVAAAAWQARQVLAPDGEGDLRPLAVLRSCYDQRPAVAGPSLFKNGDFRRGVEDWEQSPDATATRRVEPDATTGAKTLHVSFKGGNWAVLMQGLLLQPDTPYVYRMRVRSTAPIVALYWQTADGGHPFEQNRVYPEWTDLVFVFVTPHWGGRPMAATVSPVLAQAPGEVWVADVQLRPLTFDPRMGDGP